MAAVNDWALLRSAAGRGKGVLELTMTCHPPLDLVAELDYPFSLYDFTLTILSLAGLRAT